MDTIKHLRWRTPRGARLVRYGAFAAGILALTAGPLALSAAAAAPRAADAVATTSVRQEVRPEIGPTGITASWQLDTPPGTLYFADRTGTITVSGAGFTPGSTVDVWLTTASGTYGQTRTVSEPSLFCGTKFGCTLIPGGYFTAPQGGVGCGETSPSVNSLGDALITATDQQSGATATAVVATPCPAPPQF
jgi:hypothetical protein